MRPTAVLATAFAALVATAGPAAAQSVVTVTGTTEGALGPTDGVTTDPDIASTLGLQDELDLSTGHVIVADLVGATPALFETTEQFWTAAGITGTPNAYEHRAYFDPNSQRYFVTADEHVAGPNRRYLAISSGVSAFGSWSAIALPATGTFTSTRLAVDSNGVYLASDNGSGTTTITAIPLLDAIAATPTAAAAVTLTVDAPDVIPAIALAGTTGTLDPELFAARASGSDGYTAIELYALTWSATGSAAIAPYTIIDLGTSFPAPPTAAVQPVAPLLAPGGAQLRDFYTNGSQFYGMAATTVDDRAGAFWFAGAVGGGPVTTGAIGALDTDVIAPAFAVDEAGDVGVIATATSQSQYPTIVVAGMSAAAFGSGGMTPLVPVSEVRIPYDCNPVDGVSSFGRYSALSPLPGANGFFGDAMTGQDPDTACAFSTQLTEFQVASSPQPPGGSGGECCAGGGGGGADPIDEVPDMDGCRVGGGSGGNAAVLLVVGVVLARRRRDRAA
jgi:hypothetical protein